MAPPLGSTGARPISSRSLHIRNSSERDPGPWPLGRSSTNVQYFLHNKNVCSGILLCNLISTFVICTLESRMCKSYSHATSKISRFYSTFMDPENFVRGEGAVVMKICIWIIDLSNCIIDYIKSCNNDFFSHQRISQRAVQTSLVKQLELRGPIASLGRQQGLYQYF